MIISPLVTSAAIPDPPRRQARINRVYARRSSLWWPPLAVLAVLVGLWYLLANYYASQQLAFLVPYPHLVVKAAFADPLFTPQLVADLGNSAQVALTGLLIAIVIGVVWATLMAQARWIERSLFPYAVILQCIPILALVPLIGALFGYEFLSRVIVTVMISIFRWCPTLCSACNRPISHSASCSSFRARASGRPSPSCSFPPRSRRSSSAFVTLPVSR